MTNRRAHRLRLGALLAAGAILVAACGSDSKSTSTTPTTAAGAATTAAASATTAASSATTAATSGSSGSTSAPASTAASAGSGPATTASATPAKDGGALHVRVAVNPSSLDPQAGPSGSDHVMMYPIYDTLVNFDLPTLKAEPGLAKSWSYPDPTTLQLKLQTGVKFQDGSTLIGGGEGEPRPLQDADEQGRPRQRHLHRRAGPGDGRAPPGQAGLVDRARARRPRRDDRRPDGDL